MKVDPSGLAAAAQRILAALAELTGGDPVHPALAADPVSAGAAARLTAAATTLTATLSAQAAALAVTAARLDATAAGFAEQETLNAAGLEMLAAPAAAALMVGYAPPPPPGAPDVRPPLVTAALLPGEVIATALNAGSPAAGTSFISAWSRVADAADDAANLLRRTANGLPEVWDSPVATPIVRNHLIGYADAIGDSAARARALASQAGLHGEQHARAVTDVPAPERFQAVQRQLVQVSQANAASGGKLSGAVAALTAQKAALENQAQQAYSAYQADTEATTAPDSASGDRPGRDPAGAAGRAGQLAGMIPSVLGAAGGLVGGAVAALAKIPETLAQAGSQLAGAATQGLSGATKPADDHRGPADAPLHRVSGGGGAGGAGTTPAAGGPASPLTAVVPATGAAPHLPGTPAGGVPAGPEPSSGPTGSMPMAMPMGAMMPPGMGSGSGQKTARPKTLIVPPTPHTESVTGKVTPDRIAASARPPEPERPEDDPLHPGRPIVRRITMPQDTS